ncbi:MAG: hypothetical protein ABIP71_06885 [Verrucomicrobiota bacterium]
MNSNVSLFPRVKVKPNAAEVSQPGTFSGAGACAEAVKATTAKKLPASAVLKRRALEVLTVLLVIVMFGLV